MGIDLQFKFMNESCQSGGERDGGRCGKARGAAKQRLVASRRSRDLASFLVSLSAHQHHLILRLFLHVRKPHTLARGEIRDGRALCKTMTVRWLSGAPGPQEAAPAPSETTQTTTSARAQHRVPKS
jgi:hypothetical protein